MLPLTRAEATRYTETSRHADVMRFIRELSTTGDSRLQVRTFGVSPEGREMPVLVLSADGIRKPGASHHRGRPVVLMMDGIHPGEVEGKEATLMLIRDLLARDDDLLRQLTLVVVPLFNPDGNDAIDPANRRLDVARLSGQDGPATGVGTRTNSAGINLNRDYMRQASAEMRLLQAHVVHRWCPDLTIDNHATNGSVHRFATTYDVPHTIESGRREPIEWMRDRLVPAVTAEVRKNWGLDSGWYGNFVEDERALDARVEADPHAGVREGWMTYPHHPRFGSNYRGLTGRMDLLLECYSYLPFEERVRTAYAWQLETLRYAAAHAGDLLQTVATSVAPPSRVAVRYRIGVMPEPVEVLTRQPRTLAGAPTSVLLPHVARFVGTTVVDRPRAYAVPQVLATFLRRHGLKLDRGRGVVEVEVATVEGREDEGARAILEASESPGVHVSWRPDARSVNDRQIVPTDQPLGALAVYMCEPESDDGAMVAGVVPEPLRGQEFAVWRVR